MKQKITSPRPKGKDASLLNWKFEFESRGEDHLLQFAYQTLVLEPIDPTYMSRRKEGITIFELYWTVRIPVHHWLYTGIHGIHHVRPTKRGANSCRA